MTSWKLTENFAKLSKGCFSISHTWFVYIQFLITIKLGPHNVWFVFVMRHTSWFAHRVYEKMCLIWVDVSFRQLGGKLTHQSKLYVLDSTNLFDTFTHDAPRIRTTHREDPTLAVHELHGWRSQVWSASVEVWAYSCNGVGYNFVFVNLNFVIRMSKKFEKTLIPYI